MRVNLIVTLMCLNKRILTLFAGVRHQVFDPAATKDEKGRIILKGITAIDQKICATELSSQVITTAQNFSKKINKISNLGFGIDMEVFKVGAGMISVILLFHYVCLVADWVSAIPIYFGCHRESLSVPAKDYDTDI